MTRRKSRQARLGMAQCFLRMENQDAAIKALKPLPVQPTSEYERHCLALAGEALLRQENSVAAESVLELSLAGLRRRLPVLVERSRLCKPGLCLS